MLTEKQVSEIREHLEKAQNPVFFFDNDPDGLCSFLLLQRYIGRGRGVVIKSFPNMEAGYFRKVSELNADYIFILDKPLVSKEFFEKVKEVNIPVVWIDHHEIETEAPDFINYYNPMLNSNKTNEPVTALCYQITGNKEDVWIAVAGCVSDSFFPPFYKEFKEKYPELSIETEDAFEVVYNSRVGDIIRILSNGLKDTVTNVVLMIKFLFKVKSPYDILEENSKNKILHKRSEKIKERYDKILEKGKKIGVKPGKILFFRYSGDLSVSGEISNHLKYLFPKKIVVVAYVGGSKINLSLRGKGIKEKFLKAIEGINGATGGGHNDAVGGQLISGDLDKFKKNLQEIIDKG